jgi:CxxH/CxxC protein (TIGR04129 family)
MSNMTSRGAYAVCIEHVEIGLDEWIDEYESAPNLVAVSDEQRAAAVRCYRCAQAAYYFVELPEDETIEGE